MKSPSYSKEQFEFYNQIALWISEQIRDRDKPLFVGLNAPQGAGKTTLCNYLVDYFAIRSKKLVSISIDDFYLARKEQEALANKHKHIKELQFRGYPGTHDIELGRKILLQLKESKKQKKVRIPRYDKSAYSGLGERLKPEFWSLVQTPVDVVILEGWMLGFSPPSEFSSEIIDKNLFLYKAWTDLLDSIVVLNADNVNDILRWRVEAEQNMRRSKGKGMTDQEAKEYIKTFMPAYEKYRVNLNAYAKSLVLTIGPNRLPL